MIASQGAVKPARAATFAKELMSALHLHPKGLSKIPGSNSRAYKEILNLSCQ